jgi:hypothetical protein
MGEAELAATGGNEEYCDEALGGLCSDGWNEAGCRVSVGDLRIGAEMESLMGDDGFCDESFVRFFFRNQGERIEAEAEVGFGSVGRSQGRCGRGGCCDALALARTGLDRNPRQNVAVY